MTAWTPVKGRALASNVQVSPSFIPFKIEFKQNEFRKILFRKVEEGFGYLLRYVTITWLPWFWHSEEGYKELGDCDIEFYVRRQSRQTNPIPCQVISTPAVTQITTPIVPPVNSIMCPLFAQNLGSQKYLNYFFQFGDTIEFHVTREGSNFIDQDHPDPDRIAYVMYVIFKGYICPEPQARIW